MQSDGPSMDVENAEVLQTRAARHDAIREALNTQQITSQEELRRVLANQGFDTVQATLSRDLHDLRAMKVRSAAGYSVYQISDDEGRSPSAVETGPTRLGRWCQELLVSAEYAQNVLVLRTPAGAANMLAVAVDSARLDQVVGTVAGDDTVITICRSEEAAKTLRKVLLDLVGSLGRP